MQLKPSVGQTRVGDANGDTRVTSFDRLAWRCSWVAPVALTAALAAVALHMARVLGSATQSLGQYLPAFAMAAAVVGLLAHLVVQYHAVRPGSFSDRVRRQKVEVALRLAMGYGVWREAMREQHPELRPRAKATG